MNRLIISLACFLVAACQQAPEPAAEEAPAAEPTVEAKPAAADVLAAVLDAQPKRVKMRYRYRHPQETLEFFGIEPGMTVVEGLPGQGWYTKILLPYLGPDGHLVAADYSLEMYPKFPFVDEAFMKRQRNWATDFPTKAAAWAGEDGAGVAAFHLGAMPAELAGTADVVFFVRLLHNLARFEPDGGFLTQALADAYAVLKPGGVLGVVQHHARDEMSDEFADGSHGYLKKGFVIAMIEQAGFEFVAESDINANPLDQPTEGEAVWRLPPTLASRGEDQSLLAALEAIGESNRMTLKFRKPE